MAISIAGPLQDGTTAFNTNQLAFPQSLTADPKGLRFFDWRLESAMDPRSERSALMVKCSQIVFRSISANTNTHSGGVFGQLAKVRFWAVCVVKCSQIVMVKRAFPRIWRLN